MAVCTREVFTFSSLPRLCLWLPLHPCPLLLFLPWHLCLCLRGCPPPRQLLALTYELMVLCLVASVDVCPGNPRRPHTLPAVRARGGQKLLGSHLPRRVALLAAALGLFWSLCLWAVRLLWLPFTPIIPHHSIPNPPPPPHRRSNVLPLLHHPRKQQHLTLPIHSIRHGVPPERRPPG